MPCVDSSARHKLCRPNICPEPSCCSTSTAFSCQPVCDEGCGGCCCPHEAYATITDVGGATGVFINGDFAHDGIAGVTGGGQLGLYSVFYDSYFFDGCTGALIPTVVTTKLLTPGFATPVVMTTIGVGVAVTDTTGTFVEGTFSIRAIQNNRDC